MRIIPTFLSSLLLMFAFVLVKPDLAMAYTPILSTPRIMHMALFNFAGKRPDFLGVKDGKLAPCPNSPNCVSTQSIDPEHIIPPITYTSSPDRAIANLKQVIQTQERAKIITEREDYLYVEFSSKLMGFVDDVEFYLNKDKGTIEMRSASRLGQSDLGVNRQRLQSIVAKLQELST